MDALISDRGAGALMIEGSHLFWLAPSGERERIADSDVHFLIAGRGDFHELKNVSESEVLERVRIAQLTEEGVLLTIVLLDPKSTTRMRERAAPRVAKLLTDDVVAAEMRNIFWSRTLDDADYVAGIGTADRVELPRLAAFLATIRHIQPAIQDVRSAFDAIPTSYFAPRTRDDYLYFATRDGLFRRLVERRSAGKSYEVILEDLLKKKHRLVTEDDRPIRRWMVEIKNRPRHFDRLQELPEPVIERRNVAKRPHTDYRTKVGIVVSNRMQKTVVVAVENLVKHGTYQKYVKRTSKFMAHAERNDCNIGDRVLIEETRPLSRHKRWEVRENLTGDSLSAKGT